MLRKGAALAALLLSFGLLAPTVALADTTTITAAGSTALLPLVKAAAEAYQAQNASIKISVAGGGSGVGITQAAAKAVDIGDSDIIAPGHPELVDHRVAVVGFSIIANPSAGVENLSKKQLQEIFSGKVSNWKDVGGKDGKITVINRPRSSGTRAVFVKTVMDKVAVSDAGLVEDASGTVVSTVKTTPGAISYVAFAYSRGAGVTELKVDGVAPTDENVMTGKYPVWSYEHMFTNGQPSKEISRFLAYVQSRSELVHKLGYILIREMKVSESDR